MFAPGKELIAVDGTKLEVSASKRKHYSKNKISKMKNLVQSKMNEYIHDLENKLITTFEVTNNSADQGHIIKNPETFVSGNYCPAFEVLVVFSSMLLLF
jgi:hypothetical protein